MEGNSSRSAWGKADTENQDFHHLAHHSADVAAVFCGLLEQPLFRTRAEMALGRALTSDEVSCLAALVFLHDIGKLAPGFQAKAWPKGHGLPLRGHLECGWLWLRVEHTPALDAVSQHLARQKNIRDWFPALFAHHGRPVAEPLLGLAGNAFQQIPTYDWRTEEAVIAEALLKWFPQISKACVPAPLPELLHFFCGMLTLADWIGSDRRAFPFEGKFRFGYWDTAKKLANARLLAIDLAGTPALRGGAGWQLISDHARPRPAQEAVGSVPVDEHLVLLEAETGAGKTEAALWRFAALMEAGAVEGLYFALPTRAAARQLHQRVNAALQRMFVEPPEAVLAVPGQMISGEAQGKALPGFNVLWDDSEAKPARWAAEQATRFLAARVAIGTVDQLALGGLQVKFAHLRGAAVSRSLIVIDEVHASDPYMTEVQLALVSSHLALGGHVLLMSATLGAAARRKWRREKAADLAADIALPYPAVWTSAGHSPIAADPQAQKNVSIERHSGWLGTDAAALAIEAAQQGARVLVIRNTVQRAQETFVACRSKVPELIFEINGCPTLHHSRFAAEDRALLDRAVERAIGKDSPQGGKIVVGTQTLEQSLDLCADFLITDLCPMDILLQRIGRLHRHKRARPAAYADAKVLVLCPPGGLNPLTNAPENGLGALASGPSLAGIYVDVAGLAATLEQIETHPLWQIPLMNRALVEVATHPGSLNKIAKERGWQAYHQRVTGKALAEMRVAGLAVLDRKDSLQCFPDDEMIRTRLGEEGVVLALPLGTQGAFGKTISRIALPAHWSRGLAGDEAVTVESGRPIRVTIADRIMTYGPEGLKKEVVE